MGKIKKLSFVEAQKIAAGEVVDRPINVIKELVENSLDAQATSIELIIEHAGHTSIRVIDNGVGMAPDDATLCFEHHATSKLTHFEELDNIQTFGFRGEALTSISAVSTITLTTKQADQDSGVSITKTPEGISTIQEVGCNTGTDICVKDLFFNIPARKKFLKTQSTEWRAIQQTFQAFCFAYPTIHFKLVHNNVMVYNCPRVNTLQERLTQLWDAPFVNAMKEISYQESALHLEGMISNHQRYWYDRSSLFFFVNKRWVKNPALAKAFIKGYLNVLPQDRFPAGIIFLEVDQKTLDINIHPRKEEVQFLNPRSIEHHMQQAVRKTLETILSTPSPLTPQQTSSREKISLLPQPPFSKVRSVPLAPSFVTTRPASVTSSATPLFNLPLPEAPTTNRVEKTVTIWADEKPQYLYLASFDNTYLLVSHNQELLIIDQHAAHERILYEKFKTRFGNCPVIDLLFPLTITLSEYLIQCAQQHSNLFAQNGIHLEPFSATSIRINALAQHLNQTNIQELIIDILTILDQQEEISTVMPLHVHEKIHAQMACKAAVKAGDNLSLEKATQLLNDLAITDNRFTCPHGRPTTWTITLYELEKKFKRKL